MLLQTLLALVVVGTALDQHQISGKWNELKGNAKTLWGGLTNDDFLKAEGNSDKLYGIIEQRYGESKDTIHRKLSELHFGMPSKEQVEGKWHELKGRAKSLWGGLTNDDFLKAEGNSEKLYGIIEQRYGESRDTIQKKIGQLRTA